ncbi:DUF4145 domain-containing protein [Clostridium butyricum]
MSGFQCPFCGQIMSITYDTYRNYTPNFEKSTTYNQDRQEMGELNQKFADGEIDLEFFRCPNCREITITSKVKYDNSDKVVPIRPISNAKQFPEYVPKQIKQDYEESCAILNLSPKASATLARRCLQGMIHDFWGIKEKDLYTEISKLSEKVTPDLWSALDSLRKLGNIGAHMEKDVNVIVDIDENEANSLVKLIELLIEEWYINREKRKMLFDGILETSKKKQAERKIK